MSKKYKKEKKQEEKEKFKNEKVGCPTCGDTENLVPDGRCMYCLSCGWAKCSL